MTWSRDSTWNGRVGKKECKRIKWIFDPYDAEWREYVCVSRVLFRSESCLHWLRCAWSVEFFCSCTLHDRDDETAIDIIQTASSFVRHSLSWYADDECVRSITHLHTHEVGDNDGNVRVSHTQLGVVSNFMFEFLFSVCDERQVDVAATNDQSVIACK